MKQYRDDDDDRKDTSHFMIRITCFQIYIGNQGIAANANIKQIVEVITEPEKQNKFLNFFREAHQKGQKVRVIFFWNDTYTINSRFWFSQIQKENATI